MAVRAEALRWSLVVLFWCAMQACVHCKVGVVWEVVPAVLGKPLTLFCIYNCSDGFTRGRWHSVHQGRNNNLVCPGCRWRELPRNTSGDLCTLPLHMTQVRENDTLLVYTCVSCKTDQAGLPCPTQRQLKLKITTSLTATSPSSVSKMGQTTNQDPPEDEAPTPSDAFAVVKVLAGIALVIVFVLLSYLCVLGCRRRKCAAAGSEKIPDVRHNRLGSDKDYASVTFTNTDCQSDHEVPYADIVISVRGVSTPELRGPTGGVAAQAGCYGNLKAKWREDPGPGPLQHAFRSADRLHVQPREVSRKLSSTSEYAVITYSTDADL